VETSLIEQFWYPKFGPGQLWETAAQEAIDRGAKLLKNHRVTQVHCQDGRISAVTCDTPDGPKTIEGDIFFSSMPLKDLINDMTGVQVPANISTIANGLPYRDFVTVGLLVNKLNLKKETNIRTLGNIVPDCWI
jgi:protoporphyrinogen oxidase